MLGQARPCVELPPAPTALVTRLEVELYVLLQVGGSVKLFAALRARVIFRPVVLHVLADRVLRLERLVANLRKIIVLLIY